LLATDLRRLSESLRNFGKLSKETYSPSKGKSDGNGVFVLDVFSAESAVIGRERGVPFGENGRHFAQTHCGRDGRREEEFEASGGAHGGEEEGEGCEERNASHSLDETEAKQKLKTENRSRDKNAFRPKTSHDSDVGEREGRSHESLRESFAVLGIRH
jgi:hypothetical protein